MRSDRGETNTNVTREGGPVRANRSIPFRQGNLAPYRNDSEHRFPYRRRPYSNYYSFALSLPDYYPDYYPVYYPAYYPYIPDVAPPNDYVPPSNDKDVSTASYQVVEPPKPRWVMGHWEEVPMQDIEAGESIDVYHPAVYRRQDDGTLELVEKESTTKEPKVRIILAKIWVEGHYEAESPEPAPGTQPQPKVEATPIPESAP
jgi:hypothetical protein